jgi:hypothetical protein
VIRKYEPFVFNDPNPSDATNIKIGVDLEVTATLWKLIPIVLTFTPYVNFKLEKNAGTIAAPAAASAKPVTGHLVVGMGGVSLKYGLNHGPLGGGDGDGDGDLYAKIFVNGALKRTQIINDQNFAVFSKVDKDVFALDLVDAPASALDVYIEIWEADSDFVFYLDADFIGHATIKVPLNGADATVTAPLVCTKSYCQTGDSTFKAAIDAGDLGTITVRHWQGDKASKPCWNNEVSMFVYGGSGLTNSAEDNLTPDYQIEFGATQTKQDDDHGDSGNPVWNENVPLGYNSILANPYEIARVHDANSGSDVIYCEIPRATMQTLPPNKKKTLACGSGTVEMELKTKDVCPSRRLEQSNSGNAALATLGGRRLMADARCSSTAFAVQASMGIDMSIHMDPIKLPDDWLVGGGKVLVEKQEWGTFTVMAPKNIVSVPLLLA